MDNYEGLRMDRHKGKGVFVRLNKEDKKLLETLAKHYGVSQGDAIRIALKEYAKTHGIGETP
jgi:Ribbon-helix-helix protein, copG family.